MKGSAVDVNQLLSESVDAARSREKVAFDEAAGPRGRSLVLFGAGNLGRAILGQLRRLDVEPLAFCDNNPRLWGQRVDGLAVLSPEAAARLHGKSAAVVVTVFSHGRDRAFPHFRDQLQAAGCETVLPFGLLAWKHAEQFLPNYALELPHKLLLDAERVRQGFALWADEESRLEYLHQVRWRLLLDADGFPDTGRGTPYFTEGLVNSRGNEFFVDCGAFDGDTVKGFLRWNGPAFQKVVAFEPDPNNFAQLRAFADALPDPQRARVEVHNAGVSDRPQTLRFEARGDMGARLAEDGGIEVACLRLDDVLAGQRPTFIKMDIEAAEPAALAGAAELIRRHAPLLAICVYHRQDHIWSIPLQIAALSDQYQFYLRRHEQECWDVVCYAIPRVRE